MLREKVKFLVYAAARKCAVLALIASAWLGSFADEFNDGVNRDDPNFVTASLMIANPGEELFSCVGHAWFRLECPTFKRDYSFSYESQRSIERLPEMLAGRLKMGMFRVTTEAYLDEFKGTGRGVYQYVLNLPPKVKLRLWKHLDDLAEEGIDLPYDYVKRGCAKSILDSLDAAFAPQTIKGRLQKITGREMFLRERTKTHHWNLFFLDALCGTEGDVIMEVITPSSLLAYLRTVELDGVPILTDPGREILPQTLKYVNSCFTPWVMAWLVVAWVSLLWLGRFLVSVARPTVERWLAVFENLTTGVLLLVQFLAGCFFVYMVTASHIPGYGWNWHLVPFNPVMPLVMALGWVIRPFGKMCRNLMLAFAVILAGWVLWTLLAPHTVVESSYIVLAVAYILLFIKNALSIGRNRS